MSELSVYYVRDKTDTDDFGFTVYPRIDYVELYATHELAQAVADRQNEDSRKWFEHHQDRHVAAIERENAKALALEDAGFGQARLRNATRQNFTPPYVVEEAEVHVS